MRIVTGDIWLFPDRFVVIPTNCGWNRQGMAVMGAGVAAQAVLRYPELPGWYGNYCQQHRETTPVARYENLVLFPTKPLDVINPQLSWKSAASLPLIRRSAKQLADLFQKGEQVVLPLVGCGYGQLSLEHVLPILLEYLNDNFTIVMRAHV
jgi:hypothetical protein